MRRLVLLNVLAGVMVAGTLCASGADQKDAKNLIRNDDFEKGIKHWKGFLSDYLKESDDAPKAETLLTWEQKDTADDSEGSLRLEFSNFDKLSTGYEDAGVTGSLKSPVQFALQYSGRGWIVNQHKALSIKLDAKRLKGSPYLLVCYPGKVDDGLTGVELEDEWKTYEMTLTPGEKTKQLLFTLAAQPASAGANNEVANGTVLLDNIRIYEVKGVPPEK